MGYELHVTRAKNWTDSEARPITEAEWRAHVATDLELEVTGIAEVTTPEGELLRYENPGLARWRGHPRGEEVWFDLRHGRVVVKNPDELTIVKMVSVARALGAWVVGDDGETYDSSGEPPKPPTVSLGTRIASWFQQLRPVPSIEPPVPPFRVGERVTDIRGRQGTILEIDLKAQHGMGVIRTRFDDGTELNYAAIAHDLTPIPTHGEDRAAEQGDGADDSTPPAR